MGFFGGIGRAVGSVVKHVESVVQDGGRIVQGGVNVATAGAEVAARLGHEQFITSPGIMGLSDLPILGKPLSDLTGESTRMTRQIAIAGEWVVGKADGCVDFVYDSLLDTGIDAASTATAWHQSLLIRSQLRAPRRVIAVARDPQEVIETERGSTKTKGGTTPGRP